VSEHRTEALYSKVERVLAAEIRARELAVGDRLPTETQLVERFGVSRITVRRAIQNLAARGLVEVRWGRGTFVAGPSLTQPLTELTGFVEDMAAFGLSATARPLVVETVAASSRVATALELDPGARVTHIERVRLAEGRPISLDDTYLPLDLGEPIAKDDLVNRPVFELLEQEHGVPLVDAVYRLGATKADGHAAAALEIEEGDALFRIERTSFTTGSRPVDHETLLYRADAIAFEIRLPRAGAPRPR
jgi:GntR family transcriptional regulator